MDAKQLLAELPAYFQGQLTPLTGGLTNQSWRLDTARARYWLRLGHLDSDKLGIDRAQELLAHQAGANAGLAPAIRYAKPELGILVLDWLTEPNWQSLPHPVCDAKLNTLALRVAQLHQLTPAIGSLSIASQAEFYLSQLSSACFSASYLEVLQNLNRRFKQAELNLPYCEVFCHHDLNAANLMGAKPWILDWEYAAYGDAAFELAVVADSLQLSERREQHLLAAYRAGGGQLSTPRFQARQPWVQWLTLLWAALQYQHTAQLHYQQTQNQALTRLNGYLARLSL